MAGFTYKGQLSGGKENPVTLQVLIGNSSTVAVGEVLKLQTQASGGGAIRATAGSKVLGVCVGIVDANGIDLDNTSPSNFDGTWTSSTKTYSSASNNTTNKLVKVLVVVDPMALWLNTTAATLAAADDYKYFDLTSATQIANQSGNDTAGAFLLVKRDPDTATIGTFKLAESYFSFPAVQQ